ncbi:MAG: Molybdopterin-synthase adenylyltransferase [Alphaproteobacteria bacterium MarineAlpha9_Bin4]|nr:adenylyltransferase [Pelagibacterales bacterium]PPR27232.1 MAG: Molybdopterin-synthase adenylyltransferase [Alphaproteobacteria bacterium MarineAlpha9_Bin4]
MTLTDLKLERYSRNILLPEIGGKGQEKLLESKVLVIGAGGLGSPVIMYLSAAGIGNITVIDHDKVELSNLQRQIIHNTENIGIYKTDSAASFINRLNPDIKINSINKKINIENADKLISDHDIIVDGSDNFETRYIVADTSFKKDKILIAAAITKYEGQISTWKRKNNKYPCFRCLFPNQPNNSQIINCSNNGVIGSLGGFLGSLQATEVVKEILEIGQSLAGYINLYDVLNNNFRKIKVNIDPNCTFCNEYR